MRKAIVVGSGAGGASVARELAGDFDVTVLEAGKPFRPFSCSMSILEQVRKSGLFFDEREIRWVFPAMQIRKTLEKMVLVNGIGTGGTTPIATGNALRLDHDLKQMGIDLDEEFRKLYQEIPVSTDHQQHWNPVTWNLFHICRNLGLDPQPTPKMGDYGRCTHCGRCVFGCPFGVKWDSREFLQDAVSRGVRLVTGCRVDVIVFEHGTVKGVRVKDRFSSRFIPAEIVILAAGGLGTPAILESSGIPCSSSLFVDPVLCVAAELKEAFQNTEVAMPFFFQRDHIMVSPYFDYLSFFFNKGWRKPASRIVSLMIKLSDSNEGGLYRGRVHKMLTASDQRYLEEGVDLCREILGKMGIRKEDVFLGTLNAGHPGGMLPLTERDATSLHPSALPENLYIADATILPKSPGGPPILTLMAVAKKISTRIRKHFAT